MMFYMLFLSVALVQFLKSSKLIGAAAVTMLGVVNAVLLILPILTDILFYDTWLYWAIAQMFSGIILLCCLSREFFITKGKERWLYIGLILPLIFFCIDVAMTYLGVWRGGFSSKYVFAVLFVAAMVAVLNVIPNGINTLAKAKELETEKSVLHFGKPMRSKRIRTISTSCSVICANPLKRWGRRKFLREIIIFTHLIPKNWTAIITHI